MLKQRAALYFILLFLLTRPCFSEETAANRDDVEVSYIYAAVMGSGTYLISDRRISMLRLPFEWNYHESTADEAGWTWLFPIVLGYDDLSEVGSDWIEALLPDQLVTLTVLPGFEYINSVNSYWQIKPFLQLGGGKDFSSGQSFVMTHLGVRSLNLFEIGEHWELRWGNTLSWAAEYQFDTNDRTGFGLIDTGLDVRRDTLFRLFGRQMDLGIYYIYQLFLPDWRTQQAPDGQSEVQGLHEFGLSAGLKKKHKVLGVTIQRIRLGYKTGGNFQGWTIGTEFPF